MHPLKVKSLGSTFAILFEHRHVLFGGEVNVLLDRLTHHCEIIEIGNDSWRFKHRR